MTEGLPFTLGHLIEGLPFILGYLIEELPFKLGYLIEAFCVPFIIFHARIFN